MNTLVTRSRASWLPVVTMISLYGSALTPWPPMNLASSSLRGMRPAVLPYWSMTLQSCSDASMKIWRTSRQGKLSSSYMPPVSPTIFFPCRFSSSAASTTVVRTPGWKDAPSFE
jgi:hypothetical protein